MQNPDAHVQISRKARGLQSDTIAMQGFEQPQCFSPEKRPEEVAETEQTDLDKSRVEVQCIALTRIEEERRIGKCGAVGKVCNVPLEKKSAKA